MIGNILITTALAASIFAMIMYYLTYKGYSNTLLPARVSFNIMAILVLVASAMLMHAILTHQYQYKYIFNYSSDELSTGLLMSTFYAGQEGSFMIWLVFSTIIGLILLSYTSKRGDLEPRVMMVYTLSTAFLLVLVSPLLKNPFTYIWSTPTFVDLKLVKQSLLSLPFMNNFIMQDPNSGQTFVKINTEFYSNLRAAGYSLNDFIINGKGLNPLLQNFWMQIHPPILFTGFAMSAVPFSFAFAALLKNDYREWVKQSMPWILVGTMVLGLAIMLGGYWAYGVLGWGGYWGWDPVENASLVPWLVGVALIHTMLVQNKTQSENKVGRFGKTNLILAIMVYLLVLYSTFLTRSGILGDASVHSFAEPGMMVYWLLIAFVFVFAFIGIGGIIYRWKFLSKHFNFEENLLSRELALFTASVALIASAIIILVGTSAPIFSKAVQTSFYNELNLPIAIIIGLLNGLSLLLKWKSTKGKSLLKQSRNSLIASVVITVLVITIGGVHDVMLAILAFSSIFALFINFEIAVKIVSRKKRFIGAYVAHIGIALFLIGVLASGGYKSKTQVSLIKNQPKKVFGYDLTFKGYTPIRGTNKFKFNVEIAKNNSKYIVSPVMFFSEYNNGLMREPDIMSQLTKDYYITPLGYDDGRSSNSSGNVVTLSKGKPYSFDGKTITFEKFNFPKAAMNSMQAGGDFQIGTVLSIKDGYKNYTVEPKLITKNGKKSFKSVTIKEANLKIELKNLKAGGTVDLVFSKLDEPNTKVKQPQEILTVEASIEPFISLVWLGVLVMVLGFIISAVRRSKESMI